jgi:hypothetical protein
VWAVYCTMILVFKDRGVELYSCLSLWFWSTWFTCLGTVWICDYLYMIF